MYCIILQTNKERVSGVMNIIVLTADSLPLTSFETEAEELANRTGGTNFTQAVATAADTASAFPGLSCGVFSDTRPEIGLPESGDPVPMTEHLSEAGFATGVWTDNNLFSATYNYDRGVSAGNLDDPGLKSRIASALVGDTAGELNAPESGSSSGVADWIERAYFKVYKQVRDAIGLEETYYTDAATLNREALQWLRNNPERDNFLWVHYMDTHHPYEPPREYFEQLDLNSEWSRAELSRFSRKVIKENSVDVSEDDLHDIRQVYTACCEYLGDEVQQFVGRLLNDNLFQPDRDTLVFTADHGECLEPDKKMFGHVPPAFWESIVHVPLMIARPGWDTDTVTRQVSNVHLMPTVLDAAGIKVTGTDGSVAETPDDLVTEPARFVSKRLMPGKAVKQYQGLRSESGTKVFGAHLKGEDVLMCAEFDGTGETIVSLTGYPGDYPAVADGRLTADLDSIGGPMRTMSTEIRDSEEIQSHLRELGYLE